MRVIKPFKYYGGKSSQLKYIVPLIELTGDIYAEPFCGSATVFFAKQPHSSEILNDINNDIVNFFRVLQNHNSRLELYHRLLYTPYAREEFKLACQIISSNTSSAVDRAWAWYVITNQSYGGLIIPHISNWARSIGNNGKEPCYKHNYVYKVHCLELCAVRLKDAIIDNRDAIDFINGIDDDNVMFYLDPPYPPDCLVRKNAYAENWDENAHKRFLEIIKNVRGFCVLSSNESKSYDVLGDYGWKRLVINKANNVSSERRRHNEIIWINPQLFSEIQSAAKNDEALRQIARGFKNGCDSSRSCASIKDDVNVEPANQMELFGSQLC